MAITDVEQNGQNPETLKNIGEINGLGNTSDVKESLSDFSDDDFLVVGHLSSGSVEKHKDVMTEKLKDKGFDIIALSQGLDFSLLIYVAVSERVAYYYPTVVVDENKKGVTISNFVANLRNKDTSAVYLPDNKYEDGTDDKKVQDILKEKYKGQIDNLFKVAVSVMNYEPTTYSGIADLVTKQLNAGPYRKNGRDQTAKFAQKEGAKASEIRFAKNLAGYVVTETGFKVRSDFTLSFHAAKKTVSASKNENEIETVVAHGYIDFAVVKEPVPVPVGQIMVAQQPYQNKISPTIVITYVKGISTLSGYGILGILTGAVMVSPLMYFGYILENITKYQDFINVYLNSLNAQATGYDFSKLSKEEKVSILNDILTAPAFAIDIPNNGYMEELSFLINRNTRESRFNAIASKFVGESITSKLIIGDIPIPLAEVFDKNSSGDSRSIDAVDVATKTKNKSFVDSISMFLNEVNLNNNPNSIANISLLITEIGIDGNMISTAARIFLNPEGIKEVYNKSKINADKTNLYTPENVISGAISRQGSFANFELANSRVNNSDAAQILRNYVGYN